METRIVYTYTKTTTILSKKGLLAENLSQSKNDYGENAGIVYGVFLASKVKYCIVIDDNGALAQKTTFKGFNQNIKNITFKNSLDLERG